MKTRRAKEKFWKSFHLGDGADCILIPLATAGGSVTICLRANNPVSTAPGTDLTALRCDVGAV